MAKRVDVVGQQFGELTVIKESPERLRNEIAFICKCSCGNETLATKGQLLRGAKKSCGCLRKKPPVNALGLKGQKFGKLTAIKRNGTTNNGTALWLCKCECGNTINASATSLRRGETVTCGCGKMPNINKARKTLLEDKTIDGVKVPLLTKKVRVDSGTGHKGVYRKARGERKYYEASITIKGKRKYLGTFSNIEDAIAARKDAEDKYFTPYIKALTEKENI